jgi:Ca2+-binding EF-hand superfamily protein
MSRANRTLKNKYVDGPSSPNQKRSLTRKGSSEKVRGGGGGSGKKRQLRRSTTEPSPNRDLRSSSSSGSSSSGHKRGFGTRDGSPKGRSGSPINMRGSSSSEVRRKLQLKKAGSSSSSSSSSNGRHKSINRGANGNSKMKYDNDGESSENMNNYVKKKALKPSTLTKCLHTCCSGNSLSGDWNVGSKMATDTVNKLLLKSSDLKKLRKSFEDIDLDESGEIDYDEFLDHLEENRNKFTDAVFQLIDENGDGVLEFDEFVAICGTFCMWSQGEILKFCFDTFDADGGGTIDEEEFEELAKTVAGKDPTFHGNFQRALEEFDTDGDGLIDMDEFAQINQRYPLVLFPMFNLQDKMQRCTLGARRWHQIMKEQYKLSKIREYRLEHNGDMPPESCCTSIFRFGQPRLGVDEDINELEERARIDKINGKKGGVKKKS